jgi:hypothetical protein
VSPGVRRNAIITTVTSALAFLVLFLPQITAALSLTTFGKLMSVALVGLLTTFGQLLAKCVRDRNVLKGALRVWPPEPLGVARLEALGVYPARDAEGRVSRYEPRPNGEDDALASALRASRCVIVHGPPGCGKSRASDQAASRELKDVLAIVPLDLQALRLLLDNGLELPGSPRQICLWLDGLDRFVDALDPSSLSTIEQARNPEIRIVATIRTQRWEELVGGSAQRSEAARALAQGARIVPLGAFRPEPSQEPAGEREPVDIGKPRGPLWDIRLGGVALGFIAWLIVGCIFAGGLFTPPSIDEQMETVKEQILASAGSRGDHVVVDERIELHPTEQPSWLLVTEDFPNHEAFNRGTAEKARRRSRSDDLRIYDVVDGRLKLRLHFRPRGTGVRAAEWHALPAGAGPSGDYNEGGEPEVVAGYGLPSKAYGALLPFAIDWTGDRYRIVSLTREEPQLRTRGLDAETLKFRQEVYATELTLRTAVSEPAFSGIKLRGYRVQAFALVQKPVTRLLTGYFTAMPVFEEPKMLEVHANQFRTGQLKLRACTSAFHACPAPDAEQDALIPPDRTLDDGLLEAWGLVGGKWRTPIRILQRSTVPPSAAARGARCSARRTGLPRRSITPQWAHPVHRSATQPQPPPGHDARGQRLASPIHRMCEPRRSQLAART